MINRKTYLEKLIAFKDKQIIKVITGIRRCGKSVLLQQFNDYLLQSGVSSEQILLLNFESMKYDTITNHRALYEFIREHIQPGRTYLLLDEIQEVNGWEKTVASVQLDFDCDIYITGSNAYLLSSELATHIAGRYVEIHMLPLSFKEYMSTKNGNASDHFRTFLRYGGFPGVLELEERDELIRDYLDGVYNTIVVKDILTRNRFQDVDLLDLLLKFMIDNVGNLVSANNIANYLTSSGRQTHVNTVLDYLRAYEQAFILYRAERYNLKGKRILRSPDKFYIIDSGIRNARLGFRDLDIGFMIENLVYFELLRRGYDVKVGVDERFEVDFIATRQDEKVYYQVTLSLVDKMVLERELKGLLSIRDNYPKVLLSMDFHMDEEIKGIHLQNIIDFLLEKE